MSTQKNQQHHLLTEVELEIMNVVWDLEQDCTVREVHTELAKQRAVAYTSVATIMKILEQKDVLGSRKLDKAHTYFPKLARTVYEATTLSHLAKEVFRGDPSSMVVRLLDQSELSAEELKSIQEVLDRRMAHSSKARRKGAQS